MPLPQLLWLNTAMLIVCQRRAGMGRVAARRGDVERVRKGLLGGGLLTVGFPGRTARGLAPAERRRLLPDDESGQQPSSTCSPPCTALHVLGGLVALGRTTARVRQGGDTARMRLSVELCAIYWHFLLFVWLVLFAVLVSNYLGLSICTPAVPL